MPIYEYRCERCGHQLEKLQSFRDPLLTTCPSCGDDALKRLMSQTSFLLKGEGWYVTDYKNAGKKNGSDDKGKGEGEGKGEGKGEGGAKPASDTASSTPASDTAATKAPTPPTT